ncbi:hypothetical protein F4680DRAFT_415384 [Xylaria scruposa]|nr:hypothetical protein F4680DRAFT_415384 [Xylaria scruposa]
MRYHSSILACTQALLISLLILGNAASARLWPGRTKTVSVGEQSPISESGNSAPQLLRFDARQPNLYEIALKELESEPLCHQIAARLLMNECHLLEDKNEATVLTDSTRKIQDFVDSYAASLAICDLERGSIAIPAECSKFRQSTLSQLPIQSVASLHVTTAEIDNCVRGLGASSSTWSTWLNYRHKTLMFCEAARANIDKAQNIFVSQRVVKIMSSFADGTEQRMSNLDLHTQALERKIESLSPLLGKIQHSLEHADQMLSRDILQGLKKSLYEINSGLKNVEHLEKILQKFVQSVSNGHAEVAAVHNQSLEVMSRRASLETEIMVSNMEVAIAAVMEATAALQNDIVSNMEAATAATAALQNNIEAAGMRFTDLESRQDNLEQGMQRLLDTSDKLYDTQMEAQNITNEILGMLKDTAAAVSVGFLGQNSMKCLWSFVGCPLLFLVTGSYGIPSSLLRNFGLLALGETTCPIITSTFSFVSFGSALKLNPFQTQDANQNFTYFKLS